ncbi:MAG TPA: LysR family transcriptional regulator [Microlunatus sp.]|nr:LysR family transcriptional regulator [Microlunatus sp.]
MEVADIQRIARLLPIFVTVAETEQVTIAASILRLPQPTVSRAVSSLGGLIGAPVVERRGRGIVLTAAGRELLPFAVAGLDAIVAGVAAAGQTGVVGHGEVAIAFQNVLGEAVVPALIRRFRERFPAVGFGLTQGSRQHCLDAFERGESAVALVASPPHQPETITIPLYEEPLVLVVPRHHRLADRSRVSLDAVSLEDLIALKPGYGLRSGVEGLFADAPTRPRIAFEVEDAHTARGLVSAGLGVSVLPSYPPDPETEQIRIDHPRAVRTIGAVARPGTVAPSVSAFVAYLRTSGAAVAVSALGPYARALPTAG